MYSDNEVRSATQIRLDSIEVRLAELEARKPLELTINCDGKWLDRTTAESIADVVTKKYQYDDTVNGKLAAKIREQQDEIAKLRADRDRLKGAIDALRGALTDNDGDLDLDDDDWCDQ